MNQTTDFDPRQAVKKQLLELLNEKPDEMLVVCRVGNQMRVGSVHANLQSLAFMLKIAEGHFDIQMKSANQEFHARQAQLKSQELT